MQIKEFEAFTMKECLQHVRQDLGPEAVILETRKFRKGGILGWGARDAVKIVAATGITVDSDGRANPKRDEPAPAAKPTLSKAAKTTYMGAKLAGETSGGDVARAIAAARAETSRAEVNEHDRAGRREEQSRARNGEYGDRMTAKAAREETTSQQAAVAAVRSSYASAGSEAAPASRLAGRKTTPLDSSPVPVTNRLETMTRLTGQEAARQENSADSYDGFMGDYDVPTGGWNDSSPAIAQAMSDLRAELVAMQREQRESQRKTVSAVVSAVAPHIGQGTVPRRLPELFFRLTEAGVDPELATELIEALPELRGANEAETLEKAHAALKTRIAERVSQAGPIALTPGKLKAVALIGPTGVGKTTTIAKLAAHFALVERKRVALLTVDTYRIAAVEQLKTYGQIIDIPIGVAYSQAEVLPAVSQYRDYDLLLIDTAGRSQKNVMQVAELKTLLEAVNCETHLVLSAPIKERDMLEAAKRFSAARVDRLIFSKLDETNGYGTLLNVAMKAGIPLSYMTMGQKVPEDLEVASGSRLANLLLD